MKRIGVLLFWLLACSALSAQTPTEKKGAVIGWVEQTFDFGDIVQGEKVEHTFTLINNGDEPLIITNAQVTCGCTTPKGLPRNPILPGQKADIVVAFNSTGKFGRQNKVVTLVSNAQSGSNQITFSANVLDKKVQD